MGQINNTISFIRRIEQAINNSPCSVALVDYPGKSHTYGQMALAIEGLTNILRTRGLQKGDKVAICAKNSIYWIEAYLATVIGGYVAVVLPNNLQPKDVLLLLEHADCNAIFAESDTIEELSNKLSIVFDIDFESLLFSSTDELVPFGSLSHNVNKYVCFPDRDFDDICTIMYTSGSCGNPKGVMLSVKNISCDMNCYFVVPFTQEETYHLNILLPFYHIYGLIDDALMPLCFGKEVVVFSLPFTAHNLYLLFARYKPKYFFTVPEFVKVIVEYCIGKELYSQIGEMSIQNNTDSSHFFQIIKSKIVSALGGNFNAFLVGGNSMSPEFEALMTEKIGIPILTGYGLTECGNLTNNSSIIKIHSSGIPFSYVQMRIDSESPYSIPGEIQVKGENVFVGYYKDLIATKTAFTDDGWFRTGDMGIFDKDMYLFITGRSKEVMVTASGENVYPNMIEYEINISRYVKESILVQRGEKLYAIVVPDREKAEADGLDAQGLNKKIDEAVREASKKLPGFTIISGFELRDEPLERTPKGSLKRYLYSDGIKEN